jgi:hypothetical protein
VRDAGSLEIKKFNKFPEMLLNFRAFPDNLNILIFLNLLKESKIAFKKQFNIFHSIQLKRKISQFQTNMKRKEEKLQNIERMKSNYFRIKTHDKRDNFSNYFLFFCYREMDV